MKQLSGWEKADILLKAMVPLSIAVAGWFINNQLAQANYEAERLQNEKIEQQSQDDNRRQGLSVLPQFIDALLGDDPRRKRIAIEAINRLLPDDGAAILAIVADDTSQPEGLRAQADDLARQGVRDLVNRMFDLANAANRRAAYAALARGGFEPALVISELLARGVDDLQNKNGTFNVVSFLGNMAPSDLAPFRDEIRAYAERARSNGPDTAALVANLLTRL